MTFMVHLKTLKQLLYKAFYNNNNRINFVLNTDLAHFFADNKSATTFDVFEHYVKYAY